MRSPLIGLAVFWYPKSRRDANTIPCVGFIKEAWPLDVVDLTVLPPYDGACISKLHVFHVDDPRLVDSFGNISPGGTEKGCWEFTPQSQAYIDSLAAQQVDEPTPTKKKVGK